MGGEKRVSRVRFSRRGLFFLFFHPPKVGINTVTIVCVSIDRRATAAAATATADRWTRTDTSAPLHALWALYESVHTIYTRVCILCSVAIHTCVRFRCRTYISDGRFVLIFCRNIQSFWTCGIWTTIVIFTFFSFLPYGETSIVYADC